VDAGKIDVSRTAGGHRRISRTTAIDFIRGNQIRIVRPELLGIPDLAETRQPIEGGLLSGEYLQGLLVSGNTSLVRQAVTSAFLGGMKTFELFDGPIRDSLQRVGTMWKTDQRGIYIEHSSTNAVIEVISQIAALLGEQDHNAPLAIGGAPANDPHIIPSLMASTVLIEAGWRTMNLGPDTPVFAIRDAVQTHKPELVWLAVKTKLESATLLELTELCSELTNNGIRVALGGTEIERTRESWPSAIEIASSMTELAQIARSQ
jgi:methanogenic corrinoid protein MtbC1